MLDAEKLINLLQLEPHPSEGGYFREVYRSKDVIGQQELPSRYPSSRCFGTSIYYLLTPETVSAMHRLRSDEIFHFYLGDPIEMLLLEPKGSGNLITLGADLLSGEHLQYMVPHDVWQGSRLKPGGQFALLGTTVSPGFDFEDYEHGDIDKLCSDYPDWKDAIHSRAIG